MLGLLFKPCQKHRLSQTVTKPSDAEKPIEKAILLASCFSKPSQPLSPTTQAAIHRLLCFGGRTTTTTLQTKDGIKEHQTLFNLSHTGDKSDVSNYRPISRKNCSQSNITNFYPTRCTTYCHGTNHYQKTDKLEQFSSIFVNSLSNLANLALRLPIQQMKGRVTSGVSILGRSLYSWTHGLSEWNKTLPRIQVYADDILLYRPADTGLRILLNNKVHKIVTPLWKVSSVLVSAHHQLIQTTIGIAPQKIKRCITTIKTYNLQFTVLPVLCRSMGPQEHPIFCMQNHDHQRMEFWPYLSQTSAGLSKNLKYAITTNPPHPVTRTTLYTGSFFLDVIPKWNSLEVVNSPSFKSNLLLNRTSVVFLFNNHI